MQNGHQNEPSREHATDHLKSVVSSSSQNSHGQGTTATGDESNFQGITILMINRAGRPLLTVGDSSITIDDKRILSVQIMRMINTFENAISKVDYKPRSRGGHHGHHGHRGHHGPGSGYHQHHSPVNEVTPTSTVYKFETSSLIVESFYIVHPEQAEKNAYGPVSLRGMGPIGRRGSGFRGGAHDHSLYEHVTGHNTNILKIYGKVLKHIFFGSNFFPEIIFVENIFFGRK